MSALCYDCQYFDGVYCDCRSSEYFGEAVSDEEIEECECFDAS